MVQQSDYFIDTGNISWATVKDFKKDILDSTMGHIKELEFKESSSNLARKNEVLLITIISLVVNGYKD